MSIAAGLQYPTSQPGTIIKKQKQRKTNLPGCPPLFSRRNLSTPIYISSHVLIQQTLQSDAKSSANLENIDNPHFILVSVPDFARKYIKFECSHLALSS